MKASEAYNKLKDVVPDILWDYKRSKIDETKTLWDVFNAWLNLFENNPDMTIGSIMKYNVNRDFNCL